MDAGTVVILAQNAIIVTILLSAPLMLIGMVVGLIISLFQAITQIQEMTLTFVPKIIAVMLTAFFATPWMINTIVDYTYDLITSLPLIIR